MAHGATVEVWARRVSGRRVLEVEVVEADVGASTVWSLQASETNTVRFNGLELELGRWLYVPRRGRIVDYAFQGDPGTATEFAPELNKAQVPASALEQILVCSPDDDAPLEQHLLDEIPYAFGTLPPTLFGHSRADAGSDNDATTRFVVIEGL